MFENRLLERWEVEIPCSINWEGNVSSAKITDISFNGARIRECSAIPSKEALIFILLPVGEDTGQCPAEVIHRCGREASADSGCFGVEFRGAAADLTAVLVPVVRKYVRGRAD